MGLCLQSSSNKRRIEKIYFIVMTDAFSVEAWARLVYATAGSRSVSQKRTWKVGLCLNSIDYRIYR